jgi:hypothetical protein
VALLGLLTAALNPCMSSSMIKANMAATAARGRDIYVAITSANTDREPLGLPPIWPQSNPPTTNATDISQMNFTNSTDYFWALYDGGHLGTTNHNPYVNGFDYSKLAGAGVKLHTGNGRLKPENNMWTIAKNVRDEMEDIIPILVTRNLAAESLATDLTDPGLFNRRLYFDQECKSPFGEKGFVIVRKGGGTFSQQPRYMTYRSIYNSQTFKTTIPGSQLPGLRYLTPNKEVVYSEAAYQASVPSILTYCVQNFLDWVVKIFPFYLFMGFFTGVCIFFIVRHDKQESAQLSVVGPAYWFLLWLASTTYSCCFIFIFFVGDAELMVLTFLPAIAFQFCNYLYLKVSQKRTGNTEACQKAFVLILKAPLIALPGLLINLLFLLGC